MPFLIDLTTGPPVLESTDDDRRLEFWSLDGASVIDWCGEEFIAQQGAQGLDLGPREVIRQQVQGLAGSRLVEIRDLEREVFLPLWVRANDRNYRTNLLQLRELRGFLDYRDRDYATAQGTFDLVAISGPGGTRRLRCTLLEGMEGDYGRGAFQSWRTIGLRLLAVDPHWHGEQWSTPSVTLPEPIPFLSDSLAYPFPRAISGSLALGANMNIGIPGDLPSPAVVEIFGPADSAHVTSSSGLDVHIGGVASGQTLIVDTGRTRQVLLDGSPAWGLLGPSPRWVPLPPGQSSVTITVTGATTATSARVFGETRWQTAW
jgi:hypothetical protein